MSVTVRYFAAAAEAMGLDSESFAAGSLGDVLAAMERRHGALAAEVIGRCTVMVDGQRVGDRAHPVQTGSTIDLLPPFAGG